MAAFIGWVDPNVGGTPVKRGQASIVAGGTFRKFAQSWTKATTDGNGTIYGLVEIPADGVLESLKLMNDALSGATSADFGLYELTTCAPGSTAAVNAGSGTGTIPTQSQVDAGAILMSAADISAGHAVTAPLDILNGASSNLSAETVTSLGGTAKGLLVWGMKVWQLLGFTDPKWKSDSYLLGMRLNTAGSATGNLAIVGGFIEG
jgi:hypothetical protein